MFATLLGGLPLPEGHDARTGLDAAVEAVIRAQEEAGLEPITDGRLRDPGLEDIEGAFGRWRFVAGLTDRAVKQALPGPYTLGWRVASTADAAAADGRGAAAQVGTERAARTLALADRLHAAVEALAAAGCPLVEIEEAEAHRIGEEEAERALFREAHRRLTAGIAGTHLSLSIVGKAAATAGVDTILSAPYSSLAVDLIEGPDNWNLVTRTPGDRGIVVGALGGRESTDEPKEVLLWGAHYAASTGRRGIARVGLGSAGSWANLPWVAALRKLRALGEAARLAALPPGEVLARSVDPRSISARRAALGSAAKRMPRHTPDGM